MKHQVVLTIITILLSTGCGRMNQSEIKKKEISYPVRIRLADCFTNASENLKLSDIADSISYVKLETREAALIGSIVYILPVDSGHLISDNTWSLFLFDKNGLFKWKLDNQGRGPSEYIEISGIFGVDNKLGEIILPDRKSLVVYDFNGKFKRKFTLPYYPGNVFVLPSGQYLFANNSPFVVVMARVSDRDGNLVREYINSNDDIRLNDRGSRLNTSRSESRFNKDEVLLSNKDTIWRLNANLDLETRVIIYGRLKEYKDRFYFYTSNVISKSLITFDFNFQKSRFLIDLISNKTYNITNGFADNIDFGPNVFPGRGDGKILIDCLNPTNLLAIRSGIRNGSDLVNIVQNMKEDDNPVIRIIKLKD